MKLHFVVGPFGEGRESFSRLLGKRFNDEGQHCRFSSCGSLNCLDNYGGVAALDLEFCLFDINRNVEKYKKVDHLIITGVGLGLYIEEIMPLYPDATLYFVKNSVSKLDYDLEFKESLLLLTDDITEEWIDLTNKKINDIIEQYEKNTNQLWNIIDELDEKPEVLKYEAK
jgi:hypothetical protein